MGYDFSKVNNNSAYECYIKYKHETDNIVEYVRVILASSPKEAMKIHTRKYQMNHHKTENIIKKRVRKLR